MPDEVITVVARAEMLKQLENRTVDLSHPETIVYAIVVLATENGPRIADLHAALTTPAECDGPWLLDVVKGAAAAQATARRWSEKTGIPLIYANNNAEWFYGMDTTYKR